MLVLSVWLAAVDPSAPRVTVQVVVLAPPVTIMYSLSIRIRNWPDPCRAAGAGAPTLNDVAPEVIDPPLAVRVVIGAAVPGVGVFAKSSVVMGPVSRARLGEPD